MTKEEMIRSINTNLQRYINCNISEQNIENIKSTLTNTIRDFLPMEGPPLKVKVEQDLEDPSVWNITIYPQPKLIEVTIDIEEE